MPDNPLKFVLESDRTWTAEVILPSWSGIRLRCDDDRAMNEARISDGIVQIVFAPEGRGTEPLSGAEMALLSWVLENEATISESLLDAVLREYPLLRERHGFAEEERELCMPDVRSVDGLRSLIDLKTVYVHQVQKDGLPYAGFELACTWDTEHGLGVLMHGTRVVEVGGADTAFLLWIAERDRDKIQNH